MTSETDIRIKPVARSWKSPTVGRFEITVDYFLPAQLRLLVESAMSAEADRTCNAMEDVPNEVLREEHPFKP